MGKILLSSPKLCQASEPLELLLCLSARGREVYESMWNDNPADRELWDRAVALRDQGRFEEAESILTRLIASQPTSLQVKKLLGYVYWEQQKLDKAIDCFRSATEMAPRSELSSLGLFHCLWERGDEEKAIAEARRFQSVAHSEDYCEILTELEDVDQ